MPAIVGQIIQEETGALAIVYDRKQVPQKVMAQILMGLANQIVQGLDEPKIEEPSQLVLG